MTSPSHFPPRPPRASEPSLPLLQALAWVVGAGVLAQLLGSFVSGLARTWLHAHGAHGRALDNSGFVIVPAMLTSGVTLIAVAVLAPSIAGVPLRRALGLRRAPAECYFGAALGTVMLGPLADRMMTEMQRLFPSVGLGVVPFLHELVRHLPFAAAWPALALLPGVSEELVFRGLLQCAAGRGVFAILLSAGAFAAFHVDPQHVVGVLPLGLFLAWTASRAGTLVTIFAHVVNNTVAILAAHSKALDIGYGTNEPMPLYFLPPSLLLVLLSLWLIAHTTRAERSQQPEPDGRREFW